MIDPTEENKSTGPRFYPPAHVPRRPAASAPYRKPSHFLRNSLILAALAAALVLPVLAWWISFERTRGSGTVKVDTGLAPARGVSPTPVLPAYPRSASSGEIARRARCARNLRQIAAALQAYANRNDWRYPDHLADLVAVRLMTPDMLTCPSSADTAVTLGQLTPDAVATQLARPGHVSYVYTGKGLTTPAGEDTVVAYESPHHHRGVANPYPTHLGYLDDGVAGNGPGAHVLFGDGSVRFLSPEDARQMLASAAAGMTPLKFPTSRPAAESGAG